MPIPSDSAVQATTGRLTSPDGPQALSERPANTLSHDDDALSPNTAGDVVAETTSSAETTGRLVAFVDAITAIALTLLVLPLADLVSGADKADGVLRLLAEHRAEFGAFALSFVVIFRFWWAHHELFRRISRLSRSILIWTVVWTFSIVFLPVPTAMVTAFQRSAASVALYIATLLVSSGALMMLAVTAYRRPTLCTGREPVIEENVLGLATNFVWLVVALCVGTTFASTVHLWALLLLLLNGPTGHAIRRARRRSVS